jgi:hypothetical protein
MLSYMVSSRGDQCEPKEGGSHQTIATTSDSKRNPEVSRNDDSTLPIHIQVGQTWYAI